jgi:[ribosomal protein S5]-alanine N-acetyltransferase
VTVEPLEIRTDRLHLWVPGPDAASRLLRFHDDNDAHLRRWAPPAPPGWSTLAFWERRLDDSRNDARAGRSLRMSIAWADDDERRVLGTISLTDLIRGPLQQANLGYALAERAQGKGVMTEAVRAVSTHAFSVLRLHRVSASYMPTNDRSGRVLRRVGFTVVGYARDYLFIDGAWRDHVLTQLLDPAGRPPVSPG